MLYKTVSLCIYSMGGRGAGLVQMGTGLNSISFSDHGDKTLRFGNTLIFNELPPPYYGLYWPPARPTKVRLLFHKSKQNHNFFFGNEKINIGKCLDIWTEFPMFVM